MIRKATLDDVSCLTRTEMASFASHHFPIDEETFYELLMDPFQVILVYEDTKKGVVGHLLAEILEGRTHMNVDSIAVLPDFRGQGIGKKLMRAAFDYAKRGNIPIMTLEAPESDPLLKGFYQSLGFSITGRHDDFYGDGSSCLILKMIFIVLLLLSIPLPAHAEDDFKIQMPVSCTLEKTCWLVNYPDRDTENGKASDFSCGPLTYDGHDGSDFAIRDLVAMETGVTVTAAAAGRVLRIRNDAADRMPDAEDIRQMLADKKGCGNGVVLDHGEGWQTLYCHMKKDSMRVHEGQDVHAGDVLGMVGHSGIAEFPHLHFTVIKDSTVYDPATGETVMAPCQNGANTASSLWLSPPLYQPVSIAAAGFLPDVPETTLLRIDSSEKSSLARGDAPVLSLWVQLYGVSAGDTIDMEIIGPDDRVVARHRIIQPTTRTRQYYWLGKPFRESAAAAGTYTGLITLKRSVADGSTLIRTRNATVILD